MADEKLAVSIGSIDSPIEHGHHTGRGRPSAILQHSGTTLTVKQQELLDKLPGYDDRVQVRKDRVSMNDLAALTAKEQVEFAMFTKKTERLVVRGDMNHVNITPSDAKKLSAEGYKWSGHTHVGLRDGWELSASDGDYEVLSRFNQKESVIYNVKGEYQTFKNEWREEVADD